MVGSARIPSSDNFDLESPFRMLQVLIEALRELRQPQLVPVATTAADLAAPDRHVDSPPHQMAAPDRPRSSHLTPASCPPSGSPQPHQRPPRREQRPGSDRSAPPTALDAPDRSDRQLPAV
jgi:hypothetical protein